MYVSSASRSRDLFLCVYESCSLVFETIIDLSSWPPLSLSLFLSLSLSLSLPLPFTPLSACLNEYVHNIEPAKKSVPAFSLGASLFEFISLSLSLSLHLPLFLPLPSLLPASLSLSLSLSISRSSCLSSSCSLSVYPGREQGRMA